jgi:hypothetical protein
VNEFDKLQASGRYRVFRNSPEVSAWSPKHSPGESGDSPLLRRHDSSGEEHPFPAALAAATRAGDEKPFRSSGDRDGGGGVGAGAAVSLHLEHADADIEPFLRSDGAGAAVSRHAGHAAEDVELGVLNDSDEMPVEGGGAASRLDVDGDYQRRQYQRQYRDGGVDASATGADKQREVAFEADDFAGARPVGVRPSFEPAAAAGTAGAAPYSRAHGGGARMQGAPASAASAMPAKRPSSAHIIAMRIMRKENFFIALVNKNVLDLRISVRRLLQRRGAAWCAGAMAWCE